MHHTRSSSFEGNVGVVSLKAPRRPVCAGMIVAELVAGIASPDSNSRRHPRAFQNIYGCFHGGVRRLAWRLATAGIDGLISVPIGLSAVRQIWEIFGVIRNTSAGTCHCSHKNTIQIATNSIRNFLPLYLPTHLQLRKPFKAIAHQVLVPVILDM